MEGTQYRCVEGSIPAPAPVAGATVTAVPTGLVTDSVGVPTASTTGGAGFPTPAAGDAGSNSGTAKAGALSTSTGSIHLAQSLASRNVVALGSAMCFAVAAWAVVGRV
jgi:hypothetical protein